MARILIADDEIAIREMIGMACRLDGHAVTEAIDTPTAISAYATARPDLLILDLSMPGGGGTEVLRQLRAAYPAGICPVVVITGYLGTLPEKAVQALGASALIEKPFTMDTLRGAVRDALGDKPPGSPPGKPSAAPPARPLGKPPGKPPGR